jgi:hypothetical protein
MLRISHCLNNRLTDGGKVVSPMRRPRSTPRTIYFLVSGTQTVRVDICGDYMLMSHGRHLGSTPGTCEVRYEEGLCSILHCYHLSITHSSLVMRQLYPGSTLPHTRSEVRGLIFVWSGTWLVTKWSYLVCFRYLDILQIGKCCHLLGYSVVLSVCEPMFRRLVPVAPYFLARLIFEPENGGDTFLRNVCSHMDYTAIYPRRW